MSLRSARQAEFTAVPVCTDTQGARAAGNGKGGTGMGDRGWLVIEHLSLCSHTFADGNDLCMV